LDEKTSPSEVFVDVKTIKNDDVYLEIENGKNYDAFLSYVVSSKANQCYEMLNNERGICMFKLSTNKCYNE
jgi:hypothetical protein